MAATAWRKPLTLAAGSAALIFSFYLLREHRGHAVGYLPYLLLLACPFLHFFHRGGHGHDATGPTPGPEPK